MPKHATLRRQSTTRNTRSTSAESNVTNITTRLVEPSAKTRHMIDAIKEQFTAFVGEFASMWESRQELAPKFVKAFKAYKEDTGLKLISFVRELDPTVPTHRDDDDTGEGYKNHPSYVAATNLNRLANAEPKKAIPANKRPVTPWVALARLVATVLPLVDTDGSIWDAFVKECHWDEAQAKRLQALANREQPIPLAPQKVGAIRRRLAVGA